MQEKLNYLKTEFPAHLAKLTGDETPLWGVMNAQQMVEHMGAAFIGATGKMNFKVMTPAEQLPAFKSFLMSDKEFKPNTKNALMSETPEPVRFDTLETAIEKLKKAIAAFEEFYVQHPEAKNINPFFGELNFKEQTQLLHKHARHHLRQFRLID
jgi:hypothetical protein